EADVAECQAAHVAGVERAGGRDADLIVLAGDLGDVAHGGLRERAATGESDVDVVEADVFEKTFAHAVEDDAGKHFAGIIGADEVDIGERHRLGDGGANSVKGNVAH